MTELQKLNVKDFVERICYLHAQAKVCRQFSPLRLVDGYETKIHVQRLEDFMAIQDLFGIKDSEIAIKDYRNNTSLPTVHYEFMLKDVRILYVALEGQEGFDLPKKEVPNENNG